MMADVDHGGADHETSMMEEERVQSQSQSKTEQPERQLPWCYPSIRGNPIFRGNPEALAWSCSSFGVSMISIGSYTFLAPTMISMAKVEAGCAVTAEEEGGAIPECFSTVRGFRPSSLFFVMNTAVSVATVFFIPLLGAIVDYTPYRRAVGRFFSILLLLCLIPQFWISQSTWFPLGILLSVQFAVVYVLVTLYHAYLPELSDDETILSGYSRSFTTVNFIGTFFYVVLVLVIVTAMGMDNERNPEKYDDTGSGTSRISLTITLLLSSILLFVSWGCLFQPRPPSNAAAAAAAPATTNTNENNDDDNDENGKAGLSMEKPVTTTTAATTSTNVWLEGLRQNFRTVKRILGEFHALKWFFIAGALGDAALNALAVVSLSFFVDRLAFTPFENGISSVVFLMASIPGGLWGGSLRSLQDLRFCDGTVGININPKQSVMAAMTVFAVVVGCAAAFLHSPSQRLVPYLCVAGWGFSLGWMYTSVRVLVAAILPSTGQVTELMGFYVFSSLVLAWVPTVLFTILNEAGFSVRLCLALLMVEFFLTVWAYYMMGSYEDAVAFANRMVEREASSSSSSVSTTHNKCTIENT